MSEKMTRISIPGGMLGNGLMDWGECSATQMITEIRAHAANLRKRAEEIESANDADFQIDVVRGPLVQHHVRTVQQSARAAIAKALGEKG